MLKFFPAEQLGPSVVKAWRAVLPPDVPLVPVGGISPETMAAFIAAGASGFGLGSAVYKPGMPPAAVRRAAGAFVTAYHAFRPT
jgi:2-dehydro-3-deoxyphosphogalactonate aldolase